MQQWAIPEKKQGRGGGGEGGLRGRILNAIFRGIKERNFQGLIKNEVEFPRVA